MTNLNLLDNVRSCCHWRFLLFAVETKKFVDELFDVLQTKSYLPSNQLMIPQAANAVHSKVSGILSYLL